LAWHTTFGGRLYRQPGRGDWFIATQADNLSIHGDPPWCGGGIASSMLNQGIEDKLLYCRGGEIRMVRH
jgi:hypothetical protein